MGVGGRGLDELDGWTGLFGDGRPPPRNHLAARSRAFQREHEPFVRSTNLDELLDSLVAAARRGEAGDAEVWRRLGAARARAETATPACRAAAHAADLTLLWRGPETAAMVHRPRRPLVDRDRGCGGRAILLAQLGPEVAEGGYGEGGWVGGGRSVRERVVCSELPKRLFVG